MPCAVSLIHSFRASKKKKLLILDLNGVLADINNDQQSGLMADGRVGRKLGKYIYPIVLFAQMLMNLACNERC